VRCSLLWGCNGMADQSGVDGGLRELALFAGVGGGILGGHLLGWRTVCAVERDPYAASVLVQRQNEGVLPPFPIWDDVLTWCLAGSRAKTSPQPEEGQESTGSGLDSGVRWRESFRRFDPVTSSWRTHRCLFDEALPASSVTLSRWGMTVGGVLWERLTPGLHTSGIGYGLWPTPKASTGGPDFSKMNGRDNRPIGPGISLPTMVAVWPTPCASEGLDCGTNWESLAAVDKGGRIARRIATRGGPETQQSPSAQLNPNWVEWLMGWPIGWTDLEPLGTDKFQQWLRWHGRS
jgi:hypothetical protein